MKYLKLSLLLVLALALQACAEEGFVKVFKCPDSKPFFNTVNNKCYTSEDAAEEVNKHLVADNEGEENTGNGDDSGNNGGDDGSNNGGDDGGNNGDDSGNNGDDDSGNNGGDDDSGTDNGD